MPLLAAEYEYPGVVPDCLPNRPYRLGPKHHEINSTKHLINPSFFFIQSKHGKLDISNWDD